MQALQRIMFGKLRWQIWPCGYLKKSKLPETILLEMDRLYGRYTSLSATNDSFS